jgi:hypothetical protein
MGGACKRQRRVSWQGQAFEPEMVELMGAAFDRSCAVLNIDASSETTVQVARTVIALAQGGTIKDADKLAAATIDEITSER